MWMQPMASNLIFGTTGVKNYTAIVDPNLQVAESNELNNNYTFNMTTNP
jgi:subtilase family serine protease